MQTALYDTRRGFSFELYDFTYIHLGAVLVLSFFSSALRTSIFIRVTVGDKGNPARGIRLNLSNELIEVLDDQRFMMQNKLLSQPDSALNYFLKLQAVELSHSTEVIFKPNFVQSFTGGKCLYI